MRTYLCDRSRGKWYGKLERIRMWTVKYRRDRNRTKTAPIEWLSNEKNLLVSGAVKRKDIAQFNHRQWKEVKLWLWTCAYTGAITFNFYPTCNIICTEVSSSMILTRKTKLVLIRFKQVHFPLQLWVFQWISHFVLQIASLHFHTVTSSIKFAGTHLYTWVERGIVRLKWPAQEHNTMRPQTRAQTRTAPSGM